ncbi:MAG TPA: PA0069 family radical SAM protein [Chthoniobacteraceae bacterium]|jgi:DNA repair photolyase|nr:PA0069 family radical SAM protein [Chthoniobacteraceae bacterium]
MNTSARGAFSNPKNRFERLEYIPDPPDPLDDEQPLPRTQFLRDASQSILTHNDSPDIPFTWSLNPYRGCEHGCAYCFARPTHEYLGFSAGLDFETRIMVKERAPELLRAELASPRWKPQPIALSGVTDCYQPIERRLGLTRRCVAVLAEFRNPVSVITKNHLVTRDIDLYRELAAHHAVRIHISITTLDAALAKKLEPRASPPLRRLKAVEQLASAGIPVSIIMAPCIPGLNDHEMLNIFTAAAKAGAYDAGFTPLRLPGAVAGIFSSWLDSHFPDRKEKILNRVREMRGGRLNDPRFGSRMRGAGFYAEQMSAMYQVARKAAGFTKSPFLSDLSAAAFRDPRGQMQLL